MDLKKIDSFYKTKDILTTLIKMSQYFICFWTFQKVESSHKTNDILITTQNKSRLDTIKSKRCCTRWDSNPQPLDPKSNALSVAPRVLLRCFWSSDCDPLSILADGFGWIYLKINVFPIGFYIDLIRILQDLCDFSKYWSTVSQSLRRVKKS